MASAVVLLLVARSPQYVLKWALALLIAWAVTSFILLLSLPIGRFLGERGMVAIERLMGLVLTTIAVQMFLTGIKTFLLP